MNKALITGITGQDGSYLAELLLGKGYEVHGIKRRQSVANIERIEHLKDIHFHEGDMTDTSSINTIINIVQPTEIYNLAAQSHVQGSFETPEYTTNTNALGTLRMLEAIRMTSPESRSKFYQASTSEMFGLVQEVPQKETTPFYPRSPYGVAKLYAHWITKNYCESYGIFACSGILFNHESPRRGESFVTRKIALGLSSISKGEQDVLLLGNINAKRDWGHAKDFVEAMWLMLQQEKPDDYVIATGEQHSIREFVELCAPYFNMNIEWVGSGVDEIGVDTISGKTVIRLDSRYFRPSEVDSLLGDSTKAKTLLGWSPKISFQELVEDICLNGI
jgi:GDPmannose 4,6-dehydratase